MHQSIMIFFSFLKTMIHAIDTTIFQSILIFDNISKNLNNWKKRSKITFICKNKRRGDLTYPSIFSLFPFLSKSAIFVLFLSRFFPSLCHFFFVSILFLSFVDPFVFGGGGEIFGEGGERVDNLLFLFFLIIIYLLLFFFSSRYSFEPSNMA